MDRTNRIFVTWQGRRVGTLALTPDGLCAFEYAPQWRADGFSISPFELPLKDGVFVARRTPFGGGFGVLDDSLPDGWGQLVLDRHLQKRGIAPRSLTLLDRLALVGANGRGALEFEPDLSLVPQNEAADFQDLAREAEQICASDTYAGAGIDEFLRRGGSPGGARPKVFVECDGTEWLVKFGAASDPHDIGQTEYRYSQLARQCGVEMPRTRLFEGRFFGTERYDRLPGGEKVHAVSMAGLLCADYRVPSIDYVHLFQVGLALTKNMMELKKIFRLMAFNYLIGNKDDHAKNFSFLYRAGEWHLAPAYDLLPSEGMNGYHTTSFNNRITPTDDDLVAVARPFGMSEHECRCILQEMRDVPGLATR